MLQIVSSKPGCKGPYPDSRFETLERMGSGWQRDRTGLGLGPGPVFGRARARRAGAGVQGFWDALRAEAAEPLAAMGDPREQPRTPWMMGRMTGKGPRFAQLNLAAGRLGCSLCDFM